MKQISSIKFSFTIFLTAILVIAVLPNKSYAGNALEKARQMKLQTEATASKINEKISDVNADSLQNIVVLKTGASETAEETCASDESPSEENDADNATDIGHRIVKSIDVVAIVGIITGVTVPFATLVLIIYLICRSLTTRKKMKYDLITRAIESGHPLPPEFYLTDGPLAKNKLQSGIVWIGWGLALILLGMARGSAFLVSAGMIPAFIGLSRLAVFFLQRKNEKQQIEESSDDANEA
ncbi:MAG: hypothetical protein K2L85_05360 [Paramuribaculum sp.]|nr:hypothetical protein [Paramuribaculum sp.]